MYCGTDAGLSEASVALTIHDGSVIAVVNPSTPAASNNCDGEVHDAVAALSRSTGGTGRHYAHPPPT